MRTEARRKYSCGFELTEQELRRIHDVADQQMKRILTDGKYETAYEVRYQNGAIAEPKTLDEIFEQENWGSASIRLVALRFADKLETPKTKISVTFADPDAIENADRPIFYEIEGEDRDWVFVASSQLSERISRVERFNWAGFRKSRFTSLIFVVIMMLGMGMGLALIKDPTAQRHSESVKALRQSWKNGELRDPVDALLRVEELRAATASEFRPVALVLPLFIPMLVTPLLFVGNLLLADYSFRAYHFVWGEYLTEYEKKKGRRRFVLVGVILTIVLGVLANLVTKKVGW